MSAHTLVTAAAIDIGAAALLAYVAARLARRRVTGDARLAHAGFISYWLATSLSMALMGAEAILVATGAATVSLFVTSRIITLVTLCVGFCGLMGYLWYLDRGTRTAFAPLAAVYTALGIGLVYYFLASGPIGVRAATWRPDLVYTHPIAGAGLWIALTALLLPQVIALAAYARVYYHVEDPQQRYRIALVSWSIATSLVAGGLARAFSDDLAELLTRPVSGAIVALIVLLAYQPPAWVQRRWLGGGAVLRQREGDARKKDPADPRVHVEERSVQRSDVVGRGDRVLVRK